MTQKEFNDYVNSHLEHFRLENMSRNRSHYDEMPGKDIPKELRNGMQTWINNYRNEGQ